MSFVGIDVGGSRKGFDCAAVDGCELVGGPVNLKEPEQVVHWITGTQARVIALDSPRTCAAPGETTRAGERCVARCICGIRWTPEPAKLEGNPYYEWIRQGLQLYALLEQRMPRISVVEVFPTASWTIWGGKRAGRRRAKWSREILDSFALSALPARRLNQDDRDAIAAALTARLHAEQKTRTFGPIVVPTERP